MKQSLTILLFLCCAGYGFAQHKTSEKLYSACLSDTVYYSVTTPEGWDAGQKLPVLYSFGYGMLDGDYVAAQVEYFRRANYSFPNTITVHIQANMDRIGYSYRTGQLTPTGRNFVNSLKKEIIPAVEQRYNTTAFRTYIGHSYAASYANYLFLHEWDIFSGYVLLAPEKVNPEEPPFHISSDAKDFYRKRTTFYYVAVGEHDMPRRQGYAKEIEQKIKELDSTKFYFHRDSLPGVNHTNILTFAIQPAFEHIYQLYDPYLETGHTQNAAEELQAVSQRIGNAYQMPPAKTPGFYNRFAQLAIANKDTAGLIKVLDYFESDRMKGWNMMQFGMHYNRLGLKERSKAYIEKAIAKIWKDEMQTDLGPPNLAACYSFMATELLKDDKAKAWTYLEKSRDMASRPYKSGYRNIDIYYDMGVFAADNNYKVKEGMECLQRFVMLSQDVSEDAHWLAYRKTDYYIGKCYYLLKDKKNARLHLEKALRLNPKHQEAAALLGQL